MSALRNCANFREKTRERAANFVEFRCTARAEFDRCAPRALGNTHDVGTVCGKVSAAFCSSARRLHSASTARARRVHLYPIESNALRNTPDVSAARGRISVALSTKIVRLRRSRRVKVAKRFATDPRIFFRTSCACNRCSMHNFSALNAALNGSLTAARRCDVEFETTPSKRIANTRRL